MNEQGRTEFEAWLDYWWDTSEWSDDDKEEGFLAFKSARRTQDAKVRELVEAVDEAGHYSWCRHVIHPTQDCNCPYNLAAQLKEQDDE